MNELNCSWSWAQAIVEESGNDWEAMTEEARLALAIEVMASSVACPGCEAGSAPAEERCPICGTPCC